MLVNGAYAPQLSVGGLPAGVHVSSLRSILATNPAAVEPYLGRFAPPDRQAFTALNTGFLQDGAFVWIPPGTIIDMASANQKLSNPFQNQGSSFQSRNTMKSGSLLR